MSELVESIAMFVVVAGISVLLVLLTMYMDDL